MSFLSRSTSILAKSAVSLIGLAGIAAIVASPASAQNASVSGAITRTTPAGFVTSVSGEMVAPAGMYFQGPLVVEGMVGDGFSSRGDGEFPPSAGNGGMLTLTPGELTSLDTEAVEPSTLKAEVISKLQELDTSDPAQLDAYAAILKAAAGAEGLE